MMILSEVFPLRISALCQVSKALFVAYVVALSPYLFAQGDSASHRIFLEFESTNILNEGIAPQKLNFFDMYQPTEIRQEVVDQLVHEMHYLRRLQFFVYRGLGLNPFNSLPTDWYRLEYIAHLESLRRKEGKGEACWDGRTCLLLKKTPKAPAFLAQNPNFESPPNWKATSPGGRFAFPELVVAKEHPFLTVSSAISAIRQIVTSSTFRNVHAHTFFELSESEIQERVQTLIPHVEMENKRLFAQAIQDQSDVLFNDLLSPWNAQKTENLKREIKERKPLSSEDAIASHPKYSLLALRYWGFKDGKHVLSLEQRIIPIHSHRVISTDPFEEGRMPEIRWDFSKASELISRIALMSYQIQHSNLPAVRVPTTNFDMARVDNELQRVAKAHSQKNHFLFSTLYRAKDLSGVPVILNQETGDIFSGIKELFSLNERGRFLYWTDESLALFLKETESLSSISFTVEGVFRLRNAMLKYARYQAADIVHQANQSEHLRLEVLRKSQALDMSCALLDSVSALRNF